MAAPNDIRAEAQPQVRRDSYLVESPRFPFCKGCSHTTVLRRLNEALVALQLPPKDVVLVTDIGCIGLADALFAELHTVHTTHGRSTAFATGIALADSVLASGILKTIVLIGDGGAMIGLQHLVHAAMLNVDVTVLICNNFVYGMTGGQGSGLTPECFVTATTPSGNIVPPVDLCEILRSSHAPFVARVSAVDPTLSDTLRRAIDFKGFAAVEILELCTEYAVPMNELTGKKLVEIAERNGWTLGQITESHDRLTFAERFALSQQQSQRSATFMPARVVKSKTPLLKKPVSLIIAGSAGERVQSAATTLCQAAIRSGLHVTQKNDNPVTQGSGFSLSEIWLSPKPIGFTGIEKPDVIVVTSEEGLRELQSQGVFERVGDSTAIYLDESLEWPERPQSSRVLPFRKTFGPPLAAIGALTVVAQHHRILEAAILQQTLVARLGEQAISLFSKALGLAQSLDAASTTVCS
jgi:2-oxoglutarate ferredoxin oxidoreductase subunit beta